MHISSIPRLSALAVACALGLLGTACSSGGNSASDGGAADGAASSDAPAGDAPSSSDAGAVAFSYVDLWQQILDLDGRVIVTSYGTAHFATSGPQGQCDIQAFHSATANCHVTTCPAGADAGAAGAGMNAGTITISTPTIATDPFVLSANVNGDYVSADGGGGARAVQVFSGADPVSFEVTGGAGIPGLRGTVPAPSAISVSAPALPDGGTGVVVPLANDLTVSWDAVDTPSGKVGVSIIPRGSRTILSCDLAVAPGSGTIPAAALQALHATGAAAFVANTFDFTVVDLPGFGPVQLNVFELHPDGNGGTILLQ